MRKTYAHNGIFIGILLGFLVYALTESTILGILACIASSAVLFVLIRALENMLYNGAEKAADKIMEAHARRKQKKAEQNGYYRNF
ncbi:MAG: hypothetical protein IKZ47_04680 [Clostridia bacterium]|nr:hypothetical protein [Clostridia bacterium]